MDQDLVDLCIDFLGENDLDGLIKDGHLDGQSFFEAVDETVILSFFEKMHRILTP